MLFRIRTYGNKCFLQYLSHTICLILHQNVHFVLKIVVNLPKSNTQTSQFFLKVFANI